MLLTVMYVVSEIAISIKSLQRALEARDVKEHRGGLMKRISLLLKSKFVTFPLKCLSEDRNPCSK